MVYAGDEGLGQTLVLGELEDVGDAMLPGYLDSPVGAPVIDDQCLDAIDPINLMGQVFQGDGKRVFLIETGDLYDQFHGAAGFVWLDLAESDFSK